MDPAPRSSSYSLPLERSKMRFMHLLRETVERESRLLYAVMRLCSCNSANTSTDSYIPNSRNKFLIFQTLVGYQFQLFRARFFLRLAESGPLKLLPRIGFVAAILLVV